MVGKFIAKNINDNRTVLALPTPLSSDFIMLRSFIEMGQYGSRILRDDRYFVSLSCKLTYSIQRIKQHNRDEFNFFSDFAAKLLNTFEATNVPVLNTDENFLLK